MDKPSSEMDSDRWHALRFSWIVSYLRVSRRPPGRWRVSGRLEDDETLVEMSVCQQRLDVLTEDTFVKGLHADTDDFQTRMRRYGKLLEVVIGRGHPERKSAVVNQQGRGKSKDIIEHCQKTVRPLGRDKSLLSWDTGQSTRLPMAGFDPLTDMLAIH